MTKMNESSLDSSARSTENSHNSPHLAHVLRAGQNCSYSPNAASSSGISPSFTRLRACTERAKPCSPGRGNRSDRGVTRAKESGFKNGQITGSELIRNLAGTYLVRRHSLGTQCVECRFLHLVAQSNSGAFGMMKAMDVKRCD